MKLSLQKQNGFTLVELAIVLMIIGLLIAGVLRGQELLENAKITSTIAQVNSYQAALVNFLDSYNNYPGDMAMATSKIPGCSAASNCKNGNGNSVIGAWVTALDADLSGDNENTQFWKQLALAHLISGVDPSINPVTPQWGKSHPTSKYNGGFMIFSTNYNLIDTNRPDMHGIFLRMQNNLTGTISWTEGASAISPRRAAQIDRKMDNGLPGSGTVQSYDAGVAPLSGRCEDPHPYDETSDRANCTLMFKIY